MFVPAPCSRNGISHMIGMRIVTRRMLREFWEQPGRHDAEEPLKSWFKETKAADWKTPADIKAQYRSASLLANNRVVFNIAGNKYRLIVLVRYQAGAVYIRFVGTHKEYDALDDASEV